MNLLRIESILTTKYLSESQLLLLSPQEAAKDLSSVCVRWSAKHEMQFKMPFKLSLLQQVG